MKKYYFNSNLKFSVKDEKSNENLLPNQLRNYMKNCGICGSDIHYFLHGENGGRKIKKPLC
jgi:Threonine dehydrogenase and related Zn-dependent dehydrogenases